MVAESSTKTFVTLRVWRQAGPEAARQFVDYPAKNLNPNMSFLEMLDVVNDELTRQGRGADRVRARLPRRHLRHLLAARSTASRTARARASPPARPTCAASPTATHHVEPFRAAAFPVIKDLVTDRTRSTRSSRPAASSAPAPARRPTPTAIPVPKEDADLAMDAATCIGCGACVAACKNASAMLFVAAKVSHLGLMPQGQPERDKRVLAMVNTMDASASATAPINTSAAPSARS
jgi:succinate dehydrogenase / fumarate reductase iron-sulfur subunit